jgi:hypothetical protein
MRPRQASSDEPSPQLTQWARNRRLQLMIAGNRGCSWGTWRIRLDLWRVRERQDAAVRWKRRSASGTHTPTIRTHHPTIATMGCSSCQEPCTWTP